jgi:hypothetical protein
MNLQGEQLYRFAKEFTNNTMFLYGTADRARVITGPMGSAFGMFKNWQMHYMGWMAEYTGQGIMNGQWAPFMWMNAGTAMVGGLGALPLYSTANAFSEYATDESILSHVYDMFGGEEASDAVFMGVPALFGVSLQGSAAAPFSDPARDASMLYSFVHWDRMRALGKAVGTAIDTYSVTGDHPGRDPLVRDQFARALLPRSIYRSMAVVEGNYVKSLSTGYPAIGDVGPVQRLMFAAGFNPVEVEKGYKVADELWKDQKKRQEAVQSYGRLWASAQLGRDSTRMQQLMRSAMLEGVPLDSIMRSAQIRIAKGREPQIERQYGPLERLKYRHILD